MIFINIFIRIFIILIYTTILNCQVETGEQNRNLQATTYVHGSSMRSLMRYFYESSSSSQKIISVSDLPQSYLIFGYFKQSTFINNNKYSIIAIGQPSNNYFLLNLYYDTSSSVKLKYINKDKLEILTFSYSLAGDASNQWIGLGIGYSLPLKTARIYYAGTSNGEETSLVVGSTLFTGITNQSEKDVCITCKIGELNYQLFNGQVSTVKLIYGFDITSNNPYRIFRENLNKQQSILNSIDLSSYVPNSEYDLDQGFECNENYAFFEGVCVQKNNCESLALQSDENWQFESGKFFDGSSKKCLTCMSDCLLCSSLNVCTFCRTGYKLVSSKCVRCDDLNICNLTCPSNQIFDYFNQKCTEIFNASTHELSSQLLSSRFFTENMDLTITPSLPSTQQITHCFMNVNKNPFTLLSFLGGAYFTSSTVLQRSWTKLPKGYMKTIQFYALFYGNEKPTQLQVSINQQPAMIQNQITLVENFKVCLNSGDQTQSIFKVEFKVSDYKSYLNLEISSKIDKWAIRKVNIIITKCHYTCNTCQEGGTAEDCTTCPTGLIINKFSCTCLPNEFLYYISNCYESPCVQCKQCTVQNCLKCKNQTGICVQCASGYKEFDGQCIQTPNTYYNIELNQKVLKIRDAIIDLSHQNKIYRVIDSWQFSNGDINTQQCNSNPSTYNLLQNNQYLLFKLNIQNKEIYHYGLRFHNTITTFGNLNDSLNDHIEAYVNDEILYSRKFSALIVNDTDKWPSCTYPPYVEDFFNNYNEIIYPPSNSIEFKLKAVLTGPNKAFSIQGFYLQFLRCHPLCQSCTQFGEDKCNQCIANAEKVNNKCQCKEGYAFDHNNYPVKGEFPGKCLPCHPSCKTCSYASINECIECNNGYQRQPNTNICKFECTEGTYWDLNQCRQCSPCCRTCFSGGLDSCHDCKSDYSLDLRNHYCRHSIYNQQCEQCSIVLNNYCGGTSLTHSSCINSGWYKVDSSVCVQCGYYDNGSCGGNQSLEVSNVCKQAGYFQYNTSQCSSCKDLNASSCGRAELATTCKQNEWIKLNNASYCVNCGNFANGECGGDQTQDVINTCKTNGYVRVENTNKCLSCRFANSDNCGDSKIKDTCYNNNWVKFNNSDCIHCGNYASNECGGDNTNNQMVQTCQQNGYLRKGSSNECTSCKFAQDSNCGENDIKDNCKDNWIQLNSSVCIYCRNYSNNSCGGDYITQGSYNIGGDYSSLDVTNQCLKLGFIKQNSVSKCSSCRFASGSSCGKNGIDQDCTSNNWTQLNSSDCVYCGKYDTITQQCGGDEPENIKEFCIKGGYLNYIVSNVNYCSSCRELINSSCGRAELVTTCKQNDWIKLNNASYCVNCGNFANGECGGDQTQDVINTCKTNGYVRVENTNKCLSCRFANSDNCGDSKIKDTCYNNNWVKFNNSDCIHCGNYVSNICGGDNVNQDMRESCIYNGYISIGNGKCSSCKFANGQDCGVNEIKNKCFQSNWFKLNNSDCVDCGKYKAGKCGGYYPQQIGELCLSLGFFMQDNNNCSSCKNVVSNKCGKIEIQQECINNGWVINNSNVCQNCNQNSLDYDKCICDPSCLTCNSFFNPLTCKSCGHGRYLFNNSCLPTCPNGYNTSQQECLSCTDEQMPFCQNFYPTCLLGDPNNTNSKFCKKCSNLTRYLANDGECKCLEPEDDREIFFECSYQQIAVLKATLSNINSTLTIEFGKNLFVLKNFEPNTSPQSICEYLFTTQTILLIGSSSKCTISNKSVIVDLGIFQIQFLFFLFLSIQIDYTSQIFNGDFIYFKQNILSFQNSPQTTIKQYMNNVIIQDKILGEPLVQFNHVPVENSCNDIKISLKQLKNVANRGFYQLEWVIQSYNPPNPIYQQVLDELLVNANRNRLTNILIPKGITFPDLQFSIQFKYTLHINVKGSIQFPVTVKAGKNISLKLKTSFTSPFFIYQSGIIEIESIIKICLQDRDVVFLEPFKFNINSVELTDINFHNLEYNSQVYQFQLKPYTLQPKKININVKLHLDQFSFNLQYILIKVNAQLISDPEINSVTSYSFDVVQSKLKIQIISANGYSDFKKQLIIQSKIRDFDILNELDPQDIEISWTCINLNKSQACVKQDGKEIKFPSQSTAIIDSYTFEPYTIIKIELTGKKFVDRIETDTATILLSELDIPPLDVQLFKTTPKYNTINLNEEIFTTLNYSSSMNEDLLTYTGSIYYEDKVGHIKFDYTSLKFQIWNYFNNFQRQKNEIEFRFSILNPQYYMPSIFKQKLLINSPPYDCKFSITPLTNGFSIETQYIIRMENCKDEDEPIQYQFFYYTDIKDFIFEKENILQVKRRQLTDKQNDFLIETLLPSGKILLLAQAIDQKFAVYNTTIEIDVQQKQYNEQEYLSIIQLRLDEIGKIPTSVSISHLSIISDDILQRLEFRGSSQLNLKKIEIIRQLQTLSKNLSHLSTFSTVASKAITSLIQSGITFEKYQQTDFLNQLTQNLDNLQNLYEQNLLLFSEKQKQNLYDNFLIINALKNSQYNSESIIEITDKIGSYIFKNTLPNEDPVYFKGSSLSIYSSQITEKNLCLYFLCEESSKFIDSMKQSTVYNFKRSEFSNNPYSQDDSFLNYTNQLKQKFANTQRTISNYPVISPEIQTDQNNQMDSFNKQQIVTFNNQERNPDQKKLVCLSKQKNNSWTKSGCNNVYNEKLNIYQCICNHLSPTTLIDDFESEILNNSLKDGVSSDGDSNHSIFEDFYNYTAFWFLVFQTLSLVVFFFIGSRLDDLDLRFSQSPQTKASEVTSVQQLPLQQPASRAKVYPTSQIQINYNKNGKEQQLNPDTLQTDNQSKNFSPISLESVEMIERKESMKVLDLNKSQFSQYGTQTQMNGLKRPRRSQFTQLFSSSPQPLQNKNEFQKKSDDFKSLSFIRQILIFHNFFGAFYIYKSTLPRSLRFLVFYVRSIHSLSASIYFNQDYSMIEQILISISNSLVILIALNLIEKFLSYSNQILKVCSRIFILSATSAYYYVLFEIIREHDPSEQNKFVGTFAIFYFGDLLVISMISALFQRQIAIFLMRKNKIVGIQFLLYKMIGLSSILQTDMI